MPIEDIDFYGNEDTDPVRPSPKLLTKDELDQRFPNQRRDLVCPDCGSALILKDGKFGIFYGCAKWAETQCKGSHCCRKRTAEPYGFPANAETRKARREAVQALNRLDNNEGFQSIPRIMELLEKRLGVSLSNLRIGCMEKEACQTICEIVRQAIDGLNRFDKILSDEDLFSGSVGPVPGSPSSPSP